MILKRITKEDKWVGAGAIVGILLIGVVRLVPIVTILITSALIVFGLGAMSVTCWEEWRAGRAPKTTA